MTQEPRVQFSSSHTQRLKKMVLDISLLKTKHYQVRIKSKVKQSWEMSNALPIQLGVLAIEKEAFSSLSTTIANFYFSTSGVSQSDAVLGNTQDTSCGESSYSWWKSSRMCKTWRLICHLRKKERKNSGSFLQKIFYNVWIIEW